jgi:hypothetical protein
MDKLIIANHMCQSVNRESASSSSPAQLGERSRPPSTGNPPSGEFASRGDVRRGHCVSDRESELTQFTEVPAEVPG